MGVLGGGCTVVGLLSACRDDANEGGAGASSDAATDIADGSSSLDADAMQFLADVNPDPKDICKSLIVETDMTPNDAGGRCAIRYEESAKYCFVAPSDGGTCESAYSTECLLNAWTCSLSHQAEKVLCGPTVEDGGACCYILQGSCPIGRPFMVGGVARQAAIARRDDWLLAVSPNAQSLDHATRSALADYWLQNAQAEHASIASFARFAMTLLAVGAPVDLMVSTHRAIADETNHARTCFGFATAYGGVAFGPGELAMTDAIPESLELATIAASCAAEGCVAETVSAAIMRDAAEHATDPDVRRQMSRMADEEVAHSILAWSFVRWALAQGDQRVRSSVATVFANAERHVGFGVVTKLRGDAAQMRAHGYASIRERSAIATEVLRDVVRPAAQFLMSGHSPSPSTRSMPS